MLVPLSWLKKYVSVDLSPTALAHKLTMAGTEATSVEQIGADWAPDKILVGEILKLELHPNADRLKLTTVDLGDGETRTVVCGAPNVAVGQKIAFARTGARLFNTRSGRIERLRTANIRGVESGGMVCSERELGLGDDHQGIIVLDEDTVPGTPLQECLGDVIVNLDITPNRPDCLSILGIAHEVAALTGRNLVEPELTYSEEGPPISDLVEIDVANPELCTRYSGSVVIGVKVGPSPRWLQDAIVKAGQRPINNIVDVTNYVMLEYGQPLHAFDLQKVQSRKVIVRVAASGETLTTLDEETRNLLPPMLVIADSQKPIALAGVIGGSETAVSDETTNILIESANFDPVNTRRTASSLRISTDASYRFERGIRPDLVPRALRRATQLVLQVAGGEAARGTLEICTDQEDSPPVKITQNRVRSVLGVDYKAREVEDTLLSLGFESVKPNKTEGHDGWEIRMRAPYWRTDISIEEDLIEEVARIVGYDGIPTTSLSTAIPHPQPRPFEEIRDKLRDFLVAVGMQETISYPLTSLKSLEDSGALVNGPPPLRVANPMNNEMQFLRTGLRGSVLETLASNRRVSIGNGLRLFEIGRVYIANKEISETTLPDENEIVVGVVSGPRHQTTWLAPPGDMDFFDAKGIIERTLIQLNLDPTFDPDDKDSIMQKGRAARISCSGIYVGLIGELNSNVLERFAIDSGPVAMFELDLRGLYGAASQAALEYSTISRFPESERDIALIVDLEVAAVQIQTIINRHQLVKICVPFDVYSGGGVPSGKKSITLKITYQSPRATLTAAQIDHAQTGILGLLKKELGAELRT